MATSVSWIGGRFSIEWRVLVVSSAIFCACGFSNFLLANRYGPTLDVQIGDRLNIVCPYYSSSATPRLDAYLEIYRVPKDGYEKCMLSESSRIVGVCATPEAVTLLTLVVREFTANPSGLEFKPGQRYYFITTSNGSREGMSNAEGGLCRSSGMKMTMDVQNAVNNLTSKPPKPAKEYFFITYQTPEFFEDDDDDDQTTQIDYDDSQNGEITTAVTNDYDTGEWIPTTAKGDTTDMWYIVHTRSPDEQQTLTSIDDNQWSEGRSSRCRRAGWATIVCLILLAFVLRLT